jgi:predicted Zn-dependent protease
MKELMVNMGVRTTPVYHIVVLLSCLLATSITGSGQTRPAAASAIDIRTEPNAVVWIDEVRRGVTNSSGQLAIPKISHGRHILRVRAAGFAERTLPLTTATRTVTVELKRSNDPAELTFQKAESAMEKASDDTARKEAAELYRAAIKLRPTYAAAYVGLARALLELHDYPAALAEIQMARRYRPVYPEASAVEGRIYRSSVFLDKAIASFKRSVREARGFQPESHTGLALAYEEQGKYDDAAKELGAAISQLSDAEPIVYQLLGAIYERQEKYKEAVAAYEKYIELAPNGSLAPAVRSMLDQLRRQAAGERLMP